FHLLADETLELARLGELALHSRGTDFQRVVAPGDHVLYVEDRTDILRYQFAVGMRDASGLVDENTQDSVAAGAEYKNFHNPQLEAGGDPLGDFLDLRDYQTAVCHASPQSLSLRPSF